MLRYLALAAVITAAPAAAITAPSAIYVFGDSLVDAGNVDAAVGSDKFNPRAAGYAPGRFTNGPDYTDLLSQNLYGKYLTPSLLGGTNFAFGGARIVDVGGAVPDLARQLGAYYQASGNKVDPNALYIINDGGNDVFGLESGKLGSYATPAAYTTALLDTLAGTIQSLAAHGAGRILVTGIPNVDATGIPLELLVQARLDAIQPGLGSAQLLRFSYQNFFTQLTTNPAAFGVAPFTQAGNCIGNRPVVSGNIDCTGYFSFDGTHPTAQVQAALYRSVLGATGLDTVPEPASWALMIAGFGMVGTVLRRRKVIAA
jgi:phospholipase/lecithinase/hemolysin